MKEDRQLRAGVEELEVEMGRRKGLMREERVYVCCKVGEVEDVGHFVRGCEAWVDQRRGMREQLNGISERWGRRVRVVRGWGRRERVDWILRGGQGKR